MSQAIIRKYRKDDRSAVRAIAWETAFMGEPASAFFASRETLVSFLTMYFTDYEPQSCFVAEAEGKVVGYLIGAKNVEVLERVFKEEIFWPLLAKALMRGESLILKNLKFGFFSLRSLVRNELAMPDFSGEYPATLHINLAQGWRGQGIGSQLISAYFEYLRREHVPGVSLATISEQATDFFTRKGFILLHQGRRSYFRNILHRDILIYIYGKKF